ncbi:MAG: GTPase HflX, partial [Beijerinckiaceae bacterium]|nr:GTPase HflX [Beijerinckiaceae bacterium]
DPVSDRRLMEVWNKCDLLLEPLADGRNGGRRISQSKAAMVSALTGQGVEDLRAAIETRLAAGRVVFEISLDPGDGAGLNWLHRNTEILRKMKAANGSLHLRIRVAAEWAERVRRTFPAAHAAAKA